MGKAAIWLVLTLALAAAALLVLCSSGCARCQPVAPEVAAEAPAAHQPLPLAGASVRETAAAGPATVDAVALSASSAAGPKLPTVAVRRAQLDPEDEARRYPSVIKLRRDEFPADPGPAPPARGRVLHVAPKGEGDGSAGRPFGSIAAAVAEAKPGDQVLVAPGSYREGPSGESAAIPLARPDVTLLAAPGGRVLVQPRTPEYRHGIIVSADHVRVIGIELEGFVGSGVLFGDSHGQRDLVLRDVTVRAPKDGQWHDGILTTVDNRASRVPAITGLRLQGVRVYGASLGISCNAGPCRSWRLHDVLVEGAEGDSSGADGIAIEEGENILMSSVQVRQVSADGIDLKGQHVVIYDSVVEHVGRNGIKLWQDGDLVNSVIHHTGADAALVLAGGGSGRLRLLHTLVAYHNWQGDRSYNMTLGYPDRPVQVEILNSVFFNCSGGGYLAPDSKLDVRGTLWTGMTDGQVLVLGKRGGAREVVRLDDTAETFLRLGLGKQNPAFGLDPGLDEQRGFRPRPGSPLIGAGVEITEARPPLDLAGKARPRGRAPTIGPFEP